MALVAGAGEIPPNLAPSRTPATGGGRVALVTGDTLAATGFAGADSRRALAKPVAASGRHSVLV